MTQTITKFDRSDNTVSIYADYGQGRTRLAKIFSLEKFTLTDLRELIKWADMEEQTSWPDDHYVMDALNAFAEGNRPHIWRVSSESGGGAAMNGVKEFHPTFRDARIEAESQFC